MHDCCNVLPAISTVPGHKTAAMVNADNLLRFHPQLLEYPVYVCLHPSPRISINQIAITPWLVNLRKSYQATREKIDFFLLATSNEPPMEIPTERGTAA